MSLRPFLKVIFLVLIPSIVVLVLSEIYWGDLLRSRWPDNVETWKGVPRQLAITGIWLSITLLCLNFVTYLLSPERSRKRSRPELPALLRDLIRYGVLIVAVAFILRGVWGEEVAPIIGALGVGGVVLGFALQETLSNFFAGLALLAEQPFTQGDWIRIGDRVEGTVEHVTWRATKIRTRDSDYQIFPNSMVAKEVIVNFRQPTRLHAIRLQIGTSYDDPPDLVKSTLLGILSAIPEVEKSPPPVVYLKAYADFSINYELKCFIEEYDRRPIIEDQIMHRIWYTFRRVGIEIPFPIQTVYEHKVPADAERRKGQVDVAQVLCGVPIFSALTREELGTLAASAKTTDFGAGEPVIRQGEPGDTLYAIISGSARVAVKSDGGAERTVATLKSGEVFGEMSLLTGDPRAATVYAEDGLRLCSVSKESLLPLLQANPPVAEKMAEIVTLRRQGLDRVQSAAVLDSVKQAEVQTATRNLLGRIRSFFRLG